MDALQLFEYEDHRVRVVKGEDGEPWFVAADVCTVLDLNNVTEALRGLDEDEKSIFRITDREGRGFPSPAITEAGLYSIVLRSRKPEAKRFKRWITHEVLPAIRKHGAYATPVTIDRILEDPDYGIRLLQTLKQERQQRLDAEAARDEALRTKAQIGQRREATAMATASSALRKVEVLERKLGDARDWKQAKAIPWLPNYIDTSASGAWSQVGKVLTGISRELGLDIRKADDSAYGSVNVYHTDAIHELQHQLDSDPTLLLAFRRTRRRRPVNTSGLWIYADSIPWVPQLFDASPVCREDLELLLKRVSRQMGTAYIPVTEPNGAARCLFHSDVVDEVHALLQSSPELLSEHRKDGM